MTGALLGLLIATAVSLKGATETAAADFAAVSPGDAITVQGAASGILVTQIEQGSPVDVFISASPTEVTQLDAKKLLAAGTRRAIATNRLTVVVRKGLTPPASLEGLIDDRFARIAVGNPKTVPAGRYADQALRSVHVLDRLGGRLILGENVKQVLDYVARGEADAGIVYATDATSAGDNVVRGPDAPEAGHDPIVYEGAVIAGAAGAARGRAFLDYLVSPPGRSTFARAGFGPPPPP